VYTNDKGDRTPYSQFLGCGPPLDVLGRPGDIFVNITRGAYGVFVKYTAGWVEWAGIQKYSCSVKRHAQAGTHPPLFHPHNENLTICFNMTDVAWIPRANLGGARGELFRRRPGQSRISAGEMIEATTVLAKKIDAMYDEARKRLAQMPLRLASPQSHSI